MAEQIRRQGPLRFDSWMEAALYDPDDGFFSRGRGSGRAGSDFLTSPEVGSLFGVMMARALDRWWEQLGRPDPYLVVDAGAGRGRLAAEVLRATPECGPALRYLLVERSAALREAQADLLVLEPAEALFGPAVPAEPDELPVPVPGTGPIVASLPDLPAGQVTGVVVANELLDNLPFRVVERADGGWLEVRVQATGGDGSAFDELLLPTDDALAAVADSLTAGLSVEAGVRLPVQVGMAEWLRRCGSLLRRGLVVLVDYAAPVADLIDRGQDGWLRTYRDQGRGGHPLEAPGSQDITADVALEALRREAVRAGLEVSAETTQEAWLRSLGVDELTASARAAWHERTANDLTAIAARSRVHEADALLDPAGLGGHRVVVLEKTR